MIINKKTFSILTRPDKPNENWTNIDCYVVNDNSELGKKIFKNLPNIEYVIKNDKVVDVVVLEVKQPEPAPLTHEEINAMVVEKIREKYDINEEFKMINLGITDPENEDYVAYRNYVQECVDWGNSIESETTK